MTISERGDSGSQDNQRAYRPSRSYWLMVTLPVLLFGTVAAVGWAVPTALWQRLALSGLFGLSLLGLAEARNRRVATAEGGITVVANFRRRFIPREQIESVTWAKGGGVSLKLVGGGWVHLPEVGAGSQSLCNSIRAWLKRTG